MLLFVLLAAGSSAQRAGAAGLSDIRQRGYLIVGVKDNLRPLGFRNAAGQLEGLEIDLAHQLAKALLGNEAAVQFQPLSNQERIPALLEGKVDLLVAQMSVTGSRARIVDFSLPYYLDATGFITLDARIQSIAALQQATIAVLKGSSTIAVVRSRLPQARLVGVDSYMAAKQLLESGQAQAFASDATVLTGWVQEFPQYRLLPESTDAEALAVTLPRGLQYDTLRQQVDQAIVQWQTSGMLRQRVLQWGLPEVGIPSLSAVRTIDPLPIADRMSRSNLERITKLHPVYRQDVTGDTK